MTSEKRRTLHFYLTLDAFSQIGCYTQPPLPCSSFALVAERTRRWLSMCTPARRLGLPCASSRSLEDDECHWVILGWIHKKTVSDFIKCKNRCCFAFFILRNPATLAASGSDSGRWGSQMSLPNSRVKSTLPSGTPCSCLRYDNRGETWSSVLLFKKREYSLPGLLLWIWSILRTLFLPLLAPAWFGSLTSWCYGCKL